MGLTKKYLKSKKVYKVTFTVPESLAFGTDYVAIVGEFNNWDFNNAEMKKLKDGSFQRTFELAPGKTYQFRYMTSDGRWFNDEAADAYWFETFAGTDNSVVDLTGLENGDAPSPKKVPTKSVAKNKVKTVAKKATGTAAKKVTAKKASAKQEKKGAVAKTTSKAKATTTKTKRAVAKPVAKKGKATTSTTVKKTATTKSAKIDLKKIEGIGPKIAQILGQNGIDTYDKLASTSANKLETILKTAGPRYAMHKPASWPTQAQLAAEGKWDELSTLQQKLNGGK